MYFLGEAPTQFTLPPPMNVPVPPMPLIRVSDTRVAPFRYICRIVARPSSGSNYSIGTGVLIGPYHVLTCAHVIFPPENPGTREIVVCPAQNGDEQAGMQFKANGWAVSPNWRANNCFSAGEDFGVIRLSRPTSQGSMALQRVDPARLVRGRVNLAGYPSTRERYARHMYESSRELLGEIQIAHCVNNAPVGTTVRPTATSQLLMHELDAAKAMSGGPMWLSDLTLVAIHAGIIGTTHRKAIFLNDSVQQRIRDLMTRVLPQLRP